MRIKRFDQKLTRWYYLDLIFYRQQSEFKHQIGFLAAGVVVNRVKIEGEISERIRSSCN